MLCTMNSLVFLSTFLFFLAFFTAISPTLTISSGDGLKNFLRVDLPGVTGPESFAFDCNGEGPYVGVYDGRILKWQGSQLGWTEFAVSSPTRNPKICDGSSDRRIEHICGRPLGLKFNPKTCHLYIADAYFGLLMVGPGGGTATQIATSAGGVPFRYTNALDIDVNTGAVYFTDSSSFFQRREYMLAIMEGDRSGRLIKYDPHTKQVTVLLRNLPMPNGVSLSKDNSFLLVAATSQRQILRLWLAGGSPKSNTLQLFSKLQRWPDNIKRNENGEFWVAMHSGRGKLEELGPTDFDFDQNKVSVPWNMEDPVAIKFDESGKVLKVLNGNGGEILESVSEVEEHNGILWVGSSIKSYVGIFKA